MRCLGKASDVPLELSPERKEDPTNRENIWDKNVKGKGNRQVLHSLGWERTLHFEEKAGRTTARAEQWERGPTGLERPSDQLTWSIDP